MPGSQGPRHSGSVMVEALQVPTQASARVAGSAADATPEGLDADDEWWRPLTMAAGVTANRVTPLRLPVTLPDGRAGGGGLGSPT